MGLGRVLSRERWSCKVAVLLRNKPLEIDLESVGQGTENSEITPASCEVIFHGRIAP